MEKFVQFITNLSDQLWSTWVLVALIGTGIIVFFATKVIQRKTGLAIKKTLRAYSRSERAKEVDEGEGDISAIQALTTALASTIGVGNIAGVGTAIAMGGPGAVFWMWVSAFFGMGTKYAEIVLSQTFREKDENGNWRGGPMYVYKNGLNAKWAGYLFAISMVVVSLVSLNMMQVSSAATSLETTFKIPPIATAIVLTFFTWLVIFGGIKRLGRVTEIFVPIMAIIYLIGGLIVLIMNITEIPTAFALIFKSAFSGQAAVGGFAGATILQAARFGVARGLLSNEAGCGTAPMAHASAKVKHPAEQGILGISQVFFDTFVVCTFTALVILVTGVWQTGESGITLASHAFSDNIGFIGEAVVSIGVALFAYSTLLSGSWYGETSATFVFGTKVIKPYRVLALILCFAGVFVGSDFVFLLTDVANGFAVLINVVIVLLMLKVVINKTNEYFSNPEYALSKNKSK